MNKQITFEANAFTADNENPSKLTIQYPLTLFSNYFNFILSLFQIMI